MNKSQAVNFWKALRETTKTKDVIKEFLKRKSYGKKHTLERYAQADAGFRGGAKSEDIHKKTGWGVGYVNKIRGWWAEEFGKTKNKGTDADQSSVAEAVPERRTQPGQGQIQGVQDTLMAKELERHWDELESFGKRLRDGIHVPLPLDVVILDTRDKQLDLLNIPTDELYPYFRQHLGGYRCWEVMEQLEIRISEYRKVCVKVYNSVVKKVKKRMPSLSDSDKESLAQSLFADTCYRARGASGLSFSYNPQKVQVEDGLRWHLQLGKWSIGYCEKEEFLEPIAEAHMSLRKSLLKCRRFKIFPNTQKSVEETILDFRRTLSPDARLRKLVLEGHCELCPRQEPGM